MEDLDGIDVLEEGRDDGVPRSSDKVRARISFWPSCPDYAEIRRPRF